MLRGSRGNSETALAISGAARLTVHGSAAAVVVGVAMGGGDANGGTVARGAEAIVGSGVLDTVESLEPHPPTVSVAAAITTAHFTFPTVPCRTSRIVRHTGRLSEGDVGGRGYRAGVTRVVKVRVLPTEAEAIALEATLRACNSAANWLAARMHAERLHRRHDAQKRFYSDLRRQFGLSAQQAIRVIGKVADAYAALRANTSAGNYGPPGSPRRTRVQDKPIRFRADAAQPFDARWLSWQIPDSAGTREAAVSIRSVRGRLRNLRVIAAPRDLVLLRKARSGRPT